MAFLLPPSIEDSWLPHTLGGWLATFVALFAISGVGSVAAVWRFLMQPLRDDIERRATEFRGDLAAETRAREQADKDEHTERQHDYDMLTHNEHGILSRHKAGLKADIDGVGTRVNAIESAATDREARVRDLEARMRDTEHDLKGVHKDLGTLHADVGAFREEQTQMRVDIIAHIQAAKREQLEAIKEGSDRIGALERQVAVLDDRQRRGEQQ